jgi:hypothetical protein
LVEFKKIKYPTKPFQKDEALEECLQAFLGPPTYYDKYLDPKHSGEHMATKKAFIRGRDRTMGHSSIHTYLHQHQGTKFGNA